MSYSYDKTRDRMIGHDYPGVHGNGFWRWELDELELGARAAIALDDPEQWWWELIGNRLLEQEQQHDRAGAEPAPSNGSCLSGA